MIRYQSETFEGDPEYISESGVIQREEYKEFNGYIDEIKIKARHQFADSYKSALEVRLN
jgi:hypothetical protein